MLVRTAANKQRAHAPIVPTAAGGAHVLQPARSRGQVRPLHTSPLAITGQDRMRWSCRVLMAASMRQPVVTAVQAAAGSGP